MIQSLYDYINKWLLWGVHPKQGLSQGCYLSSSLFSIAMMPLLYQLYIILKRMSCDGLYFKALADVDDITYHLNSIQEGGAGS
jgi:hypothetical protein